MARRKVPRPITLTSTGALANRHPDTIMRWVRRGAFVQPIQFLPNRIFFDEHEVLAWLAQERGS